MDDEEFMMVPRHDSVVFFLCIRMCLVWGYVFQAESSGSRTSGFRKAL